MPSNEVRQTCPELCPRCGEHPTEQFLQTIKGLAYSGLLIGGGHEPIDALKEIFHKMEFGAEEADAE